MSHPDDPRPRPRSAGQVYDDDRPVVYAEDPYDDDLYDDGYYDDRSRGDRCDDGEYESYRRPSRRGSPIAVAAVALFAVVGIVVAATLVWASRQINPAGEPGRKVASVVVPAGTTFAGVTDILEEQDVISSARVMRWWARFNDVAPVKAGTYVDFRENSSMSDAVEVLNAGPVPPEDKVVRIIPGSWLEDALVAIDEQFDTITVDQLKFVLASGQVTSKYYTGPSGEDLEHWRQWEGYLLPETYQFDADADPVAILQRIVDEFDDTLDELGYDDAEAATGRTAHELITIASMVERETGDPLDERAKIARVIMNRLDADEPTGIDATILYGLGRRGNEGGLTRTELQTDGPYNSRTRSGLPPTAIALPSESSLAAAIRPAVGNWRWYVLQSATPRTHGFFDNYQDFLAAKDECDAKGLC